VISRFEKENPKTKLLYYEDAYLKEFKAEVLKIKKIDDRYGVILDRTAFYPVGGGQPADAGIIEGHRGKVKVIHVQIVNGTVVHIADEIKGELGPDEKVKGTIDWGRRYALMKNHTTAHLMAEALQRTTGNPLKVVGSAISVDKARLDLAYEESLGPLLPKIEEIANRIVKENVRIVEIKGLHACACGGTHVRNIDEIGAVKVLKRRSKGKGVERIEFAAKTLMEKRVSGTQAPLKESRRAI